MKEDTRRAKLAALLGIEDALPEKLQDVPTEKRHERATVSREAEAVLDFVKEPYRYKKITCRVCKRDFAVDRANVSVCSDKCRASELGAIGILWDWTKDPAERWSVTGKRTAEPLVVVPEVLSLAMEASRNYKPESPRSPEPAPEPVSSLDPLDPESISAHLL